MASADLRQDMDICTDPLTLTCGHNFPQVCIDDVLDTQEGSGVYSCPECKEESKESPGLQNITLSNIMVTHPDQEVAGKHCTYCIHSPIPAAKSCLHCEVSLCDNHLRVHPNTPEHTLCDPNTSSKNGKCSVHKKFLQYYCTEDSVCTCLSCCLFGEHRGHMVESLYEAAKKKNEKLRNVLQKLIAKRQETERSVQRLKQRRREYQEKAAGVRDSVTALFRDIWRQMEDLQDRVLGDISRQEESISFSVSDLIQHLEKEMDKLSRTIHNVEELCNMSDPVTILQEPNTWKWCDTENTHVSETGATTDTNMMFSALLPVIVLKESDRGGWCDTVELTSMTDPVAMSQRHSGDICDTEELSATTESGNDGNCDSKEEDMEDAEEEKRHGGGGDGDLDVTLIAGTIQKGLSGIIKLIHVYRYIHEPVDIILDINTSNNNMHISDDRKTASWSTSHQKHRETPERFKYFPQVMSSVGYSSGRLYWEVDVQESLWWRVGMSYPSIDRWGRCADIGDNNKSWGLWRWKNNEISVIHDRKITRLPSYIPCDRVRIYLDYEAGQLSFYSLCDPMRHLHTFSSTFTEPLYAVLCVMTGSVHVSCGVRDS